MKLRPRILYAADFAGQRICTTGLPVALATQAFALSEASQREQSAWIAEEFVRAAPGFIFASKVADPVGMAPGDDVAEPIDISGLPLSDVASLFQWCTSGRMPSEENESPDPTPPPSAE